jgi:hypothetical protein
MKRTILAVIVLSTASLFFSCSHETPSTPTESVTVTPPVAIMVPETSPAGGTTTMGPLMPPGGPGMTPPTSPVRVYSVQTDLTPSRLVYMPGEEVDMELVLTNASQGDVEPVVLSSLPPAVNLYPAGAAAARAMVPGLPMQNAPADQTVKTFPGGSGEATLAVGEKLTYDLTWDQKDGNGNQVPPGWYYYNYTCWFRPESSTEPSGSGGSNRAFLIQYPQGVMEKTIEVNQSQTASGLPFESGENIDLTITLQRVEMIAESVGFTAMVTSPSYNPPQAPGLPDPRWMLGVYATYTVDGVVHDAGVAAMNPLEDGLRLQWGYGPESLDPIPNGAKELTFTITKPGDWEGPWIFKIPLQ